MREYEVTFILQPELEEQDRKALIERIHGWLFLKERKYLNRRSTIGANANWLIRFVIIPKGIIFTMRLCWIRPVLPILSATSNLRTISCDILFVRKDE
jgi:hypothetical protein